MTLFVKSRQTHATGFKCLGFLFISNSSATATQISHGMAFLSLHLSHEMHREKDLKGQLQSKKGMGQGPSSAL